MAKENGSKFLSETERKRFNAMANFATLKGAARSLGIKPGTLYNWRRKQFKRYVDRRGWINAIEAQRRRDKKIEKIYSKRVPLEPLENIEEGLEE